MDLKSLKPHNHLENLHFPFVDAGGGGLGLRYIESLFQGHTFNRRQSFSWGGGARGSHGQTLDHCGAPVPLMKSQPLLSSPSSACKYMQAIQSKLSSPQNG